MFANPLKTKLQSGTPLLGIWSIISSPPLVEVLASAGLDFVILDMEHGNYDVGSLQGCIVACETAGASPIVRVPGVNPSAIQWALDFGASGIIVPQVKDASQVEEAVQCCKFYPRGTRGYNPFTRAGGFTNAASNREGKLSNAFGLCSVIIENETALRDVDEICLIEDLDMIYVGVYDLSVSLGFAGNTNHSEIQEIVKSVVRKVRASGKSVGVMVKSADDISTMLRLGANFLVYAVDTFVIHQSISTVVDVFNKRVINITN